MQEQIITIYFLCADYLRAMGEHDGEQSTMSTAEVMTVALVAAAFFQSNHEAARRYLCDHGYIAAERMLSKSRFNRRWHAVGEHHWQGLFAILAQAHQAADPTTEYVVDSMPVPVCDNYRIRRCKIYC